MEVTKIAEKVVMEMMAMPEVVLLPVGSSGVGRCRMVRGGGGNLGYDTNLPSPKTLLRQAAEETGKKRQYERRL